jgi:1-acyl-sn-glycerol-3-phosphate acyltransferase
MPQSRYRSGGFKPPYSGWRGKPAATFEIETEVLREESRRLAPGLWGLGCPEGTRSSTGALLSITRVRRDARAPIFRLGENS